MVEHNLAKVGVAGSNPVVRSTAKWSEAGDVFGAHPDAYSSTVAGRVGPPTPSDENH